jgi:uncharacterized protein (DUF2141 family)
MTCKRTRNYSLSIAASFVAILILMIAAAVLAQVKDTGQSPGKRNATSSTSGVSDSKHKAITRLQKEALRGGAPDLQDPMFLAPVVYSLGGGGDASVVVADVNGDGVLDVIASNPFAAPGCCQSVVSVLLGNGDGTFQPEVTYYLDYHSGGDQGGARPLAVGDVNGDGKLDILVSTFDLVEVLLGNGDGTFYKGVNYVIDENFDSIAVGDFNGDGKLDLALAWRCDAGCVGIALGNGDGTFQPFSTYASSGTPPTSVAVADVNGDGKLDLLTANYYCSDCGYTSGAVGVLLGNGDGTLQQVVSYRSIGTVATSVVAADVNGDNRPDLVVANKCQTVTKDCDNQTPGLVAVLLGNGDGTFQPAVAYNPGGAWTKTVAVADVNGDTKPDLLVTNQCGVGCTGTNDEGSVGVLLGNGDGTFQPAVNFRTGGPGALADSLAVGDFNRDGRPDLAVGNDGGILGILLNNLGPHDPTTTTLVSSPNPSAYGQSVTFSATASSSFGTPTGTVVFFDDVTRLQGATLEDGSASISVYGLRLGSHSITAKYEGSIQFSGSTSNEIDQVVNAAATTTVLGSSRNPCGPPAVILKATVSTEYGLWPTGQVTFKDGTNTIATVALNKGLAWYKAPMPRGLHAITTIYSGDVNDTGSTSAPLMQYIGYFPVTSATMVSSSQLHSSLGQPVTFTATVGPINPAFGRISDGEPVTFYDEKTILGSVPLASGTASYTTSSLLKGAHFIRATYAGDRIFKRSSGHLWQTVNKYPTTTTLSSTPNPSAYRHAVSFAATVTSAGPPPAGRVRFMDGATAIGSAALSGGVATLKKSKLTVGTHSITAQYLGDADCAKSTSSVLNQVVQ